MATHTVRALFIAVFMSVLVLVCPTRSRAEMPQGVPRIRVESRHARELLAAAIGRSPTLQNLVQQIERSNVIVYVTCKHFDSVTLQGRTMWGAASADARYVRVQVDCMLVNQQLVTILGHEFQHVVEIATAPDVVDEDGFARLFRTIGYASCGREQFETGKALETGARVREEYLDGWAIRSRVVADARSRVPLE